MSDIARLAAKLPAHEREHVCALAKDVLFMRGKLDEARKALAEQPIVVPYDHGGGQDGIKANPAYGEYERLLKSYTKAFNELRIALGAGSGEGKPHITTIVGRSKWAANG